MPDLTICPASKHNARGRRAMAALTAWACGLCLFFAFTAGPAEAAACRLMPAESLVSGMHGVFLGKYLGRGRFRVIEAYRGVRPGQIVRITGESNWEQGQRVYFAVKRVRPGTFHAPAAKDAGNVLCRSRSLQQQTDALKRLRKRGR